MENSKVDGTSLLRFIGCMGICIGIAWALQILGFGGQGSAIVRFVWMVAAASIAGAGAGLILAASAMQESERATVKA